MNRMKTNRSLSQPARNLSGAFTSQGFGSSHKTGPKRGPKSMRRPSLQIFGNRVEHVYKSSTSGKTLEVMTYDVNGLKKIFNKKIDDEQWKSIFLDILSKNPRLKTVLNLDEKNELGGGSSSGSGSTAGDKRLDAHVRNFKQFWERIIDGAINPHTPSEMSEICDHMTEVGRFHARTDGVSFDAEIWLSFKCSIVEGFCGKPKLEKLLEAEHSGKLEAHIALSKLVMFVISEMKRGFLDEIRIKLCSSHRRPKPKNGRLSPNSSSVNLPMVQLSTLSVTKPDRCRSNSLVGSMLSNHQIYRIATIPASLNSGLT